MKFNWGWGIAIFLTLFISFIMYFVIYSFSNKTDLEYEDYYAKELVHQEVIDAKTNALPFSKEVKITVDNENVLLNFPANFNVKITEGTVSFFRPSDNNLDKKFKLNLDNNSQYFESSQFKSGYYNVIIEFKDESKNYYIKESVYL